jgi:opacity protein-like surface antigen
MKRCLTLTVLALGLTASPALAQDEEDWTGFYAGVHAGGNQTRSATNVALGGAWSTEAAALRDFFAGNMAERQRDDGFNLGAQIGYNFQTGSVVLGIEAETSFLPGSETVSSGALRYPASPTLSYTFTNTIDAKHLSSIKAKAGAAFGSTLVYAEGGFAAAKARFATTATSNGNYLKAGELNKTMEGYIVGGGIEQRFDEHLSARITYDYADLGTATYATTYRPGSSFTTPAYTETVRQDLRLHLLKVGLNYRF